jgi:hypothetical protein
MDKRIQNKRKIKKIIQKTNTKRVDPNNIVKDLGAEIAGKINKNVLPNPGSERAIELGCKCPVMDNGHGTGYLGGVRNEEGNVVFVYSDKCMLHRKEYKGCEELSGLIDSVFR